MSAGAKGVKIICGGRLAGSEIARRETQKLGSIPLQTLDANVDYGVATARTTYGAIGIKVWIYKGKFGEEIVAVSRPKHQRARRKAPGGSREGTGARSGASRQHAFRAKQTKPEAKVKREPAKDPDIERKPEDAAGDQSGSAEQPKQE